MKFYSRSVFRSRKSGLSQRLGLTIQVFSEPLKTKKRQEERRPYLSGVGARCHEIAGPLKKSKNSWWGRLYLIDAFYHVSITAYFSVGELICL